MKKAAVIYLSLTGNTEKVAESIQRGLTEGGVQTSLFKLADAGEVDLYNFDLICLGKARRSRPARQICVGFLHLFRSAYRHPGSHPRRKICRAVF